MQEENLIEEINKLKLDTNSNKQINKALQELQSNVLELNKLGMEYLASQQFKQASQSLKKAQSIINKQINRSDRKEQSINRLLGITLNNLGCYYKKMNKPKVALKYLKLALQIQVYNVQDWISTAGTHLNICAIFSFLKKHKSAADHAHFAIRLLQRQNFRHQGQSNISLNNVLIVSYYNFGVQLQHLKTYYESKQAYEKGFSLTKQASTLQNMNMSKILQQCITRITCIIDKKQKKQYKIQQKKRQLQISGHYDFMRKHKRKSLTKQNNMILGMKKYPSYINSKYRSSSIQSMRNKSIDNNSIKEQKVLKQTNI